MTCSSVHNIPYVKLHTSDNAGHHNSPLHKCCTLFQKVLFVTKHNCASVLSLNLTGKGGVSTGRGGTEGQRRLLLLLLVDAHTSQSEDPSKRKKRGKHALMAEHIIH